MSTVCLSVLPISGIERNIIMNEFTYKQLETNYKFKTTRNA